MRRKTTILFITHYSGMYGANQSMCALLLDLRTYYGIFPIVLTPKRGPLCDFLDENKVRYLVSPYYWWVNAESGFYKWLLNFRKQIVNYYRITGVLKQLASYNIDLVYTNSITINIGYFISSRLKCPHIWYIRESMEQFNFRFSLGDRYAMHFFRYAANRYILISNFLTKKYAFFLPKDRVIRVYNGISGLQSVSEKPDTSLFNIVVLGVISNQKNQLDTLRAALVLKQWGYRCFRLHFVGAAKAAYFHEIHTFMKQNHLESVCRFYGHQENVHMLLERMHLGLMPSRDEAFGRVTVEYMLHEMPVIASNSGANPELIRENENGFLYELYDAEGLAARIAYFFEHPGEVLSMGQKARAFANAHFSREQNTIVNYKLIQELLDINH